MAYSGKFLFKKYKRSVTNRWPASLWDSIADIGVADNTPDPERKRIRILNSICVISIFSLLIYCLIYIDSVHQLTFYESLQGVVAYGFVMFLTSRYKFNAACHFFNIYNIISYSFEAISHGPVDAVEYILVPSSVASMLIFNQLKIIVFYFVLNGLAFALCKYLFGVVKPFLFMANGENLYTSNYILMFSVLFLIVYYFKFENIRQEKLLIKKNTNLSFEKQKSDNLLKNILPDETAEELKTTGIALTKSYNMVTVMFTDFKNFTRTAESLTPEKLVSEIHYYFSVFDEIISKYNIEKIKTIGDSYMCAGGLPQENVTNPYDVVMAALEIQKFMVAKKEEKEKENELFFEMRIGIHSGRVVAGIVGTKKFAYDIWGDTVNVAQRMEGSGEVGRVNISGATFQFIKEYFDCIYRGEISAKNKGNIEMYFVERLIENELLPKEC